MNHKALILITLVASLITILVFLTGKNLPDYLVPFTRTDQVREATTKLPHTDGVRKAPQAEPVKKPPKEEPPPTVAKTPAPLVPFPASGIYRIEKDFRAPGGLFGRAHLFNIEIDEGRAFKLNFEFVWDSTNQIHPGPVEVYLDNPQDTAFLVDRLGRRYDLLRATGITAERPVTVSPGSSRRFTLAFPLLPAMETVAYRATLVLRVVNREERLRIESDRPIRPEDFR